MVNMVVLSEGTGKPVTKVKEMCDDGQWGMVRGCNTPAGRCVFDLLWAQTGQAATYSLTSLSMVSQQKYLFMSGCSPLGRRKKTAVPERLEHCRTLASAGAHKPQQEEYRSASTAKLEW